MEIKDLKVELAIETDTASVIALLKNVAAWMRDRDIKQWGFLLSGERMKKLNRIS